MKKIKKEFLEIIKDSKYYVPLIFIFILCFGYLLTHATVNIDSLAYDRYFEGTELIKHERFLAPLLNQIFNMYSFNPFFHDFIGLIFLTLGSTLFCAIIKSIVGTKIKKIYYTIFTGIFISYPLLPEIWTYTPSNISVSIGYILTFISAFLTYEYCNNKKKKIVFIPILLLACAISLYESFAPVFITSTLMFIFLDVFYNNKKIDFKTLFIMLIKIFLITGLGLLLNIVIAKVLRKVMGLEKGIYVNKNIYYVTLGLIGGIKNLIKTIISSYFVSSLIYLPITIFVITVFLGLYFTLFQSIDKKKFSVLLLYILILVSVISLSILQGNALPYRACQTFALFIGFTLILIGSSINGKTLKKIFMIFIVLLIFYQSKEMHKWFYINDLRYQEEKNVLINIAEELKENYDITKPIILMGNYKLQGKSLEKMYVDKTSLRYKIYNKLATTKEYEIFKLDAKIGQTNVNSYINWGISAFNENGTEINKLWKMYGYDFEMGTMQMKNEIIKSGGGLSKHSSNGSIYETEKYIIVNF